MEELKSWEMEELVSLYKKASKETRVAVFAAFGDVNGLRRLRNEGYPWCPLACRAAAEKGELEMLQWLRTQDPPCPWDWRTCFDAANSGHLEVSCSASGFTKSGPHSPASPLRQKILPVGSS